MSLKSEVYSLLNNASRLCRDCPEAGELLKIIDELRGRLESPLRVAVAGIMKAGKSTFMNALMGADILYTGELETTYMERTRPLRYAFGMEQLWKCPFLIWGDGLSGPMRKKIPGLMM